MILTYISTEEGLRRGSMSGVRPADDAVWIDLLEPTKEEERAVETALEIGIPSQEEMQEIEASSRLYQQNGALYMTASVLVKTDTWRPESTAITFILAGKRLVTVRYDKPRSFDVFATRAQQAGSPLSNGSLVLVGLLDAIVDRTADLIEKIGADVDAISRMVFEHPAAKPTRSRDFHEIIRRIGRTGDVTSKVRESLVSIGRLTTFVDQNTADDERSTKDIRARFQTIDRDVHSLTDHASFLSSKINFLLDAILGMINIEQSNIIKIFSVAAVALLPPTLIASIYGMNFEHMPELDWPFGYPLALLLMVASAVVPYLYFKRRGWL